MARKGTLGRNLTHQVQNPTKLYFDKPLNAFMGAGSLGMRISDFDGDHGLTDADGLLRVGSLNCTSGGVRPIAGFGDMPQDATKATWGSEWKKAAIEWQDRAGAIGLSGEHMSYRQNFMDLDPTYTDKFGDPLLRFTLDWTEHEYRQREFSAKIIAKIARAMDAKIDDKPPSRARYNVINYQSTHIQGGAVMGTSPETSVVNQHLQHWNAPNVWVIGASAFPHNAAPNPTLTALALTYWAADAFINSYLKHPGELV